MGIELRIREPSAEGVAPSRLGAAPVAEFLSPGVVCLAGVSSTSFRNCWLFMVIFWLIPENYKNSQSREICRSRPSRLSRLPRVSVAIFIMSFTAFDNQLFVSLVLRWTLTK